MPAGIPLDGAGMQHGDQERGELFEDFQSIEIEFDCEEGKLTCIRCVAPKTKRVHVPILIGPHF